MCRVRDPKGPLTRTVIVHLSIGVLLTACDAGVVAGVSVPTGDSRHGMGMGHVMVMPGLFASWSAGRLRVAASSGYSRALGAEGHHDHAPWPLVSPMLVSEVSWNAGAEVRMTAVSVGARASGGLVGDPFTLRGVVSTALSF